MHFSLRPDERNRRLLCDTSRLRNREVVEPESDGVTQLRNDYGTIVERSSIVMLKGSEDVAAYPHGYEGIDPNARSTSKAA